MTSKTDCLLKCFPYLLSALVLAVVFYARIRLLTVPLERDEGEFAYMGQLLLKGLPPFTHAYTLKLPGVSIMYAFFMFLFGQTPAGIHAGLLIVNGLCIGLVYLLTQRLFDRDAALVSCMSYAVLSLSTSVTGLFAHATHFVVMFALAGLLLLLRSIDNRRVSLLFFSGLCFGLAVTMKQHAVLLLLFAALYFVRRVRRDPAPGRNLFTAGGCLFLLGALIPYALIVLWTVTSGSFDNFWFWTVQYAREYSATPPLALGWINFTSTFGKILTAQLPFWLLAGAGCILLCTKPGLCTDRLFVFGFVFFSFLSILPGLVFREHYFVLLLPAVAVLTGAAVSSAGLLLSNVKSARLKLFIPQLVLMAALAYSLYQEKAFFTLTPREVSRATCGLNPFPEALQIADYIRQHTTPDERIAVLGSEPELFFYADRLSATGHIYMYGLMENQPYAERMQMQMIREIEAARPKYVVYVNVPTSWKVRKASIRSVFGWADGYVQDLYERVGVIDIIDADTTRYLWDDKAAGYIPLSGAFVTVYKRKG